MYLYTLLMGLGGKCFPEATKLFDDYVIIPWPLYLLHLNSSSLREFEVPLGVIRKFFSINYCSSYFIINSSFIYAETIRQIKHWETFWVLTLTKLSLDHSTTGILFTLANWSTLMLLGEKNGSCNYFNTKRQSLNFW